MFFDTHTQELPSGKSDLVNVAVSDGNVSLDQLPGLKRANVFILSS